MIYAVLPACGLSSRMGRPKLVLPLGDRTVLEHVVSALHAGGVEHTVVVIGPHVPELAQFAANAGADVLALPAATPDMRATVAAGLAYLEDRCRPLPTDWFALAPADHACISSSVIHQLRGAAELRTHTIIVPTHEGKRGHPALIAWPLALAIRELMPGTGINTWLRDHAHETLELDVSDPGILTDLDTPEEYRWLIDAIRDPSGSLQRMWPIL